MENYNSVLAFLERSKVVEESVIPKAMGVEKKPIKSKETTVKIKPSLVKKISKSLMKNVMLKRQLGAFEITDHVVEMYAHTNSKLPILKLTTTFGRFEFSQIFGSNNEISLRIYTNESKVPIGMIEPEFDRYDIFAPIIDDLYTFFPKPNEGMVEESTTAKKSDRLLHHYQIQEKYDSAKLFDTLVELAGEGLITMNKTNFKNITESMEPFTVDEDKSVYNLQITMDKKDQTWLGISLISDTGGKVTRKQNMFMLEIVDEDEFATLIKEVNEFAYDENDNAGALFTIASKLLKDKKIADACLGIKAIHHCDGSLKADTKEIRDRYRTLIKEKASKLVDESTLKQLFSNIS